MSKIIIRTQKEAAAFVDRHLRTIRRWETAGDIEKKNGLYDPEELIRCANMSPGRKAKQRKKLHPFELVQLQKQLNKALVDLDSVLSNLEEIKSKLSQALGEKS